MQKVDFLAIGAHPDDVELGCAGTLIKAIKSGKTVGVCDLTRGELGTRGSGELRLEEAKSAGNVMGLSFRVNLGLKDGFFGESEEERMALIRVIRASQPDIVLCNAPSDRHPDHGRGASLASVACFLSGLRKIETEHEGKPQSAWRPRLVLNYIQDRFIEPTIVVDITPHFEDKMKAIHAFESQFYNPDSKEPMSAISSKEFLELQEGRALQMGRYIGTRYGEGFLTQRPVGIDDLQILK